MLPPPSGLTAVRWDAYAARLRRDEATRLAIVATSLGLALGALLMRFELARLANGFGIAPQWEASARSAAIALATGAVAFMALRAGGLASIRRWSGVLFWSVALLAFIDVMPLDPHPIRARISGSARWITLGGLLIDLVVPQTLTTLARVAHLLDEARESLGRTRWRAVGELVATLGVTEFILLVQPSRSAAMIVAVCAAGMMIATWLGEVWRSIAASALALATLMFVFWQMFSEEPTYACVHHMHAHCEALHVQQLGSLTVLGASTARQADAATLRTALTIPNGSSHFFLSAVAASAGRIGLGTMLAAFLVLGTLGLRRALRTRDGFTTAVVAGAALLLVVPVALQLLSVLALAPALGISMPLVGSATGDAVAGWVAIAVLSHRSEGSEG